MKFKSCTQGTCARFVHVTLPQFQRNILIVNARFHPKCLKYVEIIFIFFFADCMVFVLMISGSSSSVTRFFRTGDHWHPLVHCRGQCGGIPDPRHHCAYSMEGKEYHYFMIFKIKFYFCFIACHSSLVLGLSLSSRKSWSPLHKKA